jgi:hypothetical protein
VAVVRQIRASERREAARECTRVQTAINERLEAEIGKLGKLVKDVH